MNVPGRIVVERGHAEVFGVSSTKIGVSGTIYLTAITDAAGVGLTLNSSSIVSGSSTFLKVSVPRKLPKGNYKLIVAGKEGTIVHQKTATLSVVSD
jgi:hypothetical protein